MAVNQHRPGAYASAQPHAASLIGDRSYTYDANGNQTGWDHVSNGTRRTITWDEENRIQAIADNGHTLTYVYDDAGERVIKSGPQGETAYVNQFFVVRNRAVATKHIFAGGSRLVSKMASQPDTTPPTAGNSGQAPWGWLHSNAGGNSPNSGGTVFEKDQYYFHPDHLGSSSYVTDIDGEIFQHLEYFPFGETFVEESSNTQRTPYLFTGKELDEETGLYYFGARYYDPRTSVWQSPDPILASYMQGEGSGGGVFTPRNLSLYAYSHQRPVMMSDPDGKETMVTINEKARTIDIVVTVAWNGDSRPRYDRGTDAEIAREYESQSDTFSGVKTRGFRKGETFTVTFDVQFIKDASTVYDLRMIPELDDSGNRNTSKVTPGRRSRGEPGGKILLINATSSVEVFKHELNHLTGARDHYEEYYEEVEGKPARRTRPLSGWEGNVMAGPGGEMDYRIINEIIKAGSKLGWRGRGITVTYEE